jgi:hypothetical protein
VKNSRILLRRTYCLVIQGIYETAYKKTTNIRDMNFGGSITGIID